MAKCYICNSEFSNTVTNYPDGKNPCPECVEAYKSYKIDSEDAVLSDEDTEIMEGLEISNLPSFVEDYYDE